ncbi:hypothetical protein CSUI_000475 [Cystoisospora suis]|uniref:Uncharacterized protein n=1 Tax=Cystoisospora suis TaxID=483139 RepID=A0A2C6LG06_9APIC|nr:hypothetical protein CSUI_000475 [Cystoisospora suis]
MPSCGDDDFLPFSGYSHLTDSLYSFGDPAARHLLTHISCHVSLSKRSSKHSCDIRVCGSFLPPARFIVFSFRLSLYFFFWG